MPSIKVAVRFRPLNGREKKLIKETREELEKEEKELTDAEIHPFQIGEEEEFSDTDYNKKPENVFMDANNPTIKAFYAWPRDNKHVQSFTFDCIMWQVPQTPAFENVGLPVVKEFCDGMNGTLFAYGQTGSGKSFSMFGAEPDTKDASGKPLPLEEIKPPPVFLQGMIPRCAAYMFEWITRMNDSGAIKKPTSKVSFYEIYIKNQLRDLLNKGEDLKLFDSNKGVLLLKKDARPGDLKDPLTRDNALMVKAPINTLTEMIQQYIIAQKYRTVRATKMNPASSRGHCIMKITLEYIQKESGGKIKVYMNFADLAGSEKVGKTGATAELLEEAKSINSSLTVLGQVITALGKPKGPKPPFRNSALSHCLKDSLTGNCQTTLMVAASPHENNVMETISSFQFAKRCKLIKTKAKKEVVLSPKQMKALIKQLKKKIEILEAGGGGGGGGGVSVPSFKVYWDKAAPKKDSEEAKKATEAYKQAIAPLVADAEKEAEGDSITWTPEIGGNDTITDVTVQFLPNEDNPAATCQKVRDLVLKALLASDHELLKGTSKSESLDPIDAGEFKRLQEENKEMKTKIEELESELTQARDDAERFEQQLTSAPQKGPALAADGMPQDFKGYKTDMPSSEALAKLKDMDIESEEFVDVLMSALESTISTTSAAARQDPATAKPEESQGVFAETTNVLSLARQKLKSYKKDIEDWKEQMKIERMNNEATVAKMDSVRQQGVPTDNLDLKPSQHGSTLTPMTPSVGGVPSSYATLHEQPEMFDQQFPQEQVDAAGKARNNYLKHPTLSNAARYPESASLFDLIRLGLKRKKFEEEGSMQIFAPLLKMKNIVTRVMEEKKYLETEMQKYFPDAASPPKKKSGDYGDMSEDSDSDDSDLMDFDDEDGDSEVVAADEEQAHEDFKRHGVPPTLSNYEIKALLPLAEDVKSYGEEYEKRVLDAETAFFTFEDFRILFEPKFLPHHLAVKVFSHLEHLAAQYTEFAGTGVVPLDVLKAFLRDLPTVKPDLFPKFKRMKIHPQALGAMKILKPKTADMSPLISSSEAKTFIAHVRKCVKSEIRDSDIAVRYLKGLTSNELKLLLTNFPNLSWDAHIARFDPFERLLKQIDMIEPSKDFPRMCQMETIKTGLGRIDPNQEHFPFAIMEDALNRMGVDHSVPIDYNRCLLIMRHPEMGMDAEKNQLQRIAELYHQSEYESDEEFDAPEDPQLPMLLYYCPQQVQEDIYPLEEDDPETAVGGMYQFNSTFKAGNASKRRLMNAPGGGTAGEPFEVEDNVTQRLKELHANIGRFRSKGIRILTKFLAETQQQQAGQAGAAKRQVDNADDAALSFI